jgi:putative restriction endonuclease
VSSHEAEVVLELRSVPVTTLEDYLDLGASAAAGQWLRIIDRVPAARQEPFLPIETLLTFGCFYLVDHRSFGGSTSNLAPGPVPLLARLFVRTPASILAKMANLDGSWTHRAAHELELFAALSTDPARYSPLYVMTLTAARSVAIDASTLPDFLGMEAGTGLVLLGQEDLGQADLEAGIEPELRRLVPLTPVDALTTERVLEGVARIGQHRFASEVLENCGGACVFCGLHPAGLGGHRLLTASHIKPSRDCNHRERVDVTNGLAACPTHDAAFDTGLLTVNGGFRVRESSRLVMARASEPTMASSFGHPPLLPSVLLPQKARLPRTPLPRLA